MSSNIERTKSVPKYFRKTPEKPPALDLSSDTYLISLMVGGFGLVMALIGTNSSWIMLCLGSLLVVAAIPMFLGVMGIRKVKQESHNSKMDVYKKEYARAEPKPTDEQMDAWLQSDMDAIKDEAWRKLGLNHDDMVSDPDDPLLILGPSRESSVTAGKDGKVRFSKYDILLVHLTDYHLAAYQCTLDFVTGGRPSESTQEYRYSDVVAVTTETASDFAVSIQDKVTSVPSVQRFALSVASGQKIKVSALQRNADQIVGLALRGELPESGMDEAITRIRAMLREKRRD